jgi:hypothetical protein
MIDAALFTGGSLFSQDYLVSFNPVRDAAGIYFVDPDTGEKKRKHLHDVRGTFATRLILAGLADTEVAEIMAWSVEKVSGIR